MDTPTSKTPSQAKVRKKWVPSAGPKGTSGWEDRGPHHFERVGLDAEVRVVLVALDHTGLDASSPTLDENLRTIYGQQLYLLHFSDSPEKNLGEDQQSCHSKAQGGGACAKASRAAREPRRVLPGKVWAVT